MGILAKQLPKMMEKLSNHDIVLLSRYVEGGKDERSRLRIISSQVINLICRIILSKDIKDYTSGVFVMRRSVLSTIVPVCYGHGEFFIEFLYRAHKKGLNIIELPYVHPPDIKNLSKTASSIIKFFSLGFFYITRIFLSLLRRN